MELNKTFIDGLWSKEINVTSFVQTNITPYVGDASFLQGPTDRSEFIWNLCLKALEEERANNGVRSSSSALRQRFQMCLVRSVGPCRKDASPR